MSQDITSSNKTLNVVCFIFRSDYFENHFINNIQIAFVYCCPGKSPQKLRMVYSTAKGSVLQEAKSLGFSVPKAVCKQIACFFISRN